MEDNLRMDLKYVGWESVDWIDVAEDMDKWQALLNTGMKIWVP